MQKFTIPVLIGIFLLILAACGGDDDSSTTSNGSGSTTTAATAVPSTGTTGELFEFQYVCVNRTLLPCKVIQEFMAAVRAKTDGQVDIQLTLTPSWGLAGLI